MTYWEFSNVAILALVPLMLISIFILANWRFGVFIFFFWIVFEDLARKFSGNDLALFLVKDVLLIVTYASFLFSLKGEKESRDRLTTPALLPIALWVAWGIVGVFNPGIRNPIVPVMGIRMNFFYLPLLFIGYYFFSSIQLLRRFLIFYLVTVVLVGIAGIAQVALGPEFLNPEGPVLGILAATQRRELGGFGFDYLNSVFGNAARFGRFLLAALPIAAAAFVYSARRRGPLRLLGGVSLLLITINLITGGSRTLFLLLALSILGFTILLLRGSFDASARFILFTGLAVVGGLTLVASLNPMRSEGVFGFYRESLVPGSRYFEVSNRLERYAFTNRGSIIGSVKRSGFLGHGTGTASQGRQYLKSLGSSETEVPVEGGFASIAWENGAIGLGLVLWWSLSILKSQARNLRQLRQTGLYPLAAGTFLWSIAFLGPLMFMGMQNFQDFVPNSNFWFWSGVLLSLRKLSDHEEQADELGSQFTSRRPVTVGVTGTDADGYN